MQVAVPPDPSGGPAIPSDHRHAGQVREIGGRVPTHPHCAAWVRVVVRGVGSGGRWCW